MLVNRAHSIFSPLGVGTAAHLEAVLAERSAYGQQLPLQHLPSYTRFEQALLTVAEDALRTHVVDPKDPGVLFIFSTTKGNVELLGWPQHPYEPERLHLWRSAQIICDYFGNPNPPIIVSNACISGACAQIEALRQLQPHGPYRWAVVLGADVLSAFVSSGFASFKALSAHPCKPFDQDRDGLNLGEAAAAVVYEVEEDEAAVAGHPVLLRGFIRNDANHISGPSRTAEGLLHCLQPLLKGIAAQEVAFLNAHGTATRYNDDMESIALHRMAQECPGFDQVRVNSLKGYFGHTLGAAGVLESVLSMEALRQGVLIPTKGFTTPGTTYPLQVITRAERTTKPYAVKTVSGFGGTNAALLFKIARRDE